MTSTTYQFLYLQIVLQNLFLNQVGNIIVELLQTDWRIMHAGPQNAGLPGVREVANMANVQVKTMHIRYGLGEAFDQFLDDRFGCPAQEMQSYVVILGRNP